MESVMALEDLLHPYLGRYLDAPHWVKAAAGRAYRALPPRLRLGASYARFREQVADPLAASPEEKLDETLRWALKTVPAYRRYRGLLSLRHPRDILAKLPVTEKLDIKHEPERFLSNAMPAGARLEAHTGGSTQNPMRFWLHKHVTRTKEFAFMQDFRARVGAEGDELVLALRGRTVPSASKPGGALWTLEPIKRQLFLSCDHLERRFMPRHMEVLARHRPAFIEAFPSALYPLARWLAEHPLPEFTDAVRGVMLYSENVYGLQLEAFRRVFRCPIVAHYGHSERVLMAASMPDDDRFFFWPQYGQFELLDAFDQPITQAGRLGFVVGTSFDNQVMPFVRYNTGDIAMLSEHGHPRLPGFVACERIAGRMQEFIVCRDERLVSVTTLGVAHFPELAAIDAMQYEQGEPGRLVLKVVSEARLDAEARVRIAAAVEAKTQGGCDVEVVQVEGIARTALRKSKLLVQHIDTRRYFSAAGMHASRYRVGDDSGLYPVFSPADVGRKEPT
jgi:phenylacetate-CoA ligase